MERLVFMHIYANTSRIIPTHRLSDGHRNREVLIYWLAPPSFALSDAFQTPRHIILWSSELKHDACPAPKLLRFVLTDISNVRQCYWKSKKRNKSWSFDLKRYWCRCHSVDAGTIVSQDQYMRCLEEPKRLLRWNDVTPKKETPEYR